MTTQVTVTSCNVAPKDSVDVKTRLRIAANLRRLKWDWRFASDAELAEKCGLSRSVINRALKGERTIGLDAAIKIHRALGCSLDWLIEKDPEDPGWLDPGYTPARQKRR
jgi:transcriptional regulator with XRE-family HTH domain